MGSQRSHDLATEQQQQLNPLTGIPMKTGRAQRDTQGKGNEKIE